MQSFLHPSRAQADFVRCMLILGLVDLDSVIRWADKVIAESASVPEWVLDLAQAQRAGVQEVMGILNRANGESDDLSWQAALARLGMSIDRGVRSARQAAKDLYVVRSYISLPAEVDSHCCWLEDAFDVPALIDGGGEHATRSFLARFAHAHHAFDDVFAAID